MRAISRPCRDCPSPFADPAVPAGYFHSPLPGLDCGYRKGIHNAAKPPTAVKVFRYRECIYEMGSSKNSNEQLAQLKQSGRITVSVPASRQRLIANCYLLIASFCKLQFPPILHRSRAFDIPQGSPYDSGSPKEFPGDEDL
jgi:hypothetical protein